MTSDAYWGRHHIWGNRGASARPSHRQTFQLRRGRVLFSAAAGAGFIPYFEQGYQVRPSAIMGLAGIVLVSFLIDWLAFLPSIVELLLWAAVGLTVIWQLKRRAAGTDPGELAAAAPVTPHFTGDDGLVHPGSP